MSMVFALVLLGCADDGSVCERLATPIEQYGSKAQCEASQEAALGSDAAMRADYPTVVTRCFRVNGTSASGNARAKAAVSLR